MSNLDMQYYLMRKQRELNEMQNKIGEQTRIRNLRDDPVAAAQSVRFKSHITMLERFSRNTGNVKSSLRVTEGYLQEAASIMQRVREIAVAGAHGTFSAQDTQKMGEEVNQLLNELVQIANSKASDGTYLFSGDRNRSIAYREVTGHVPGSSGQVITNVEYSGTNQRNMAEISEGSYVGTNLPGNQVFWAEDQVLIANQDVTDYQVQENSTIRIDNTDIQLRAGDTVHAIVAKINDADVGVKAQLDPVKNSVVLQTTTPHQLWLEDVQGTVFQDLGVLGPNNDLPPQNINQDARITGGSVFDMVIQLRNNLYEGNTKDIGGSSLQGIDSALNNIVSSVAQIGAEDERLSFVDKRIEAEIPETVQQDSDAVDLDMAKAITELKIMEYTHQATLQTAGRILRQTLLDFLR
jgi:flagellar hook-associated protein 3 FlgL